MIWLISPISFTRKYFLQNTITLMKECSAIVPVVMTCGHHTSRTSCFIEIGCPRIHLRFLGHSSCSFSLLPTDTFNMGKHFLGFLHLSLSEYCTSASCYKSLVSLLVDKKYYVLQSSLKIN
jgi:hypothetical protein